MVIVVVVVVVVAAAADDDFSHFITCYLLTVPAVRLLGRHTAFFLICLLPCWWLMHVCRQLMMVLFWTQNSADSPTNHRTDSKK